MVCGCLFASFLKLTLTRILSPEANTSFDGGAGVPPCLSLLCLRRSRFCWVSFRLSDFFFLSRFRLPSLFFSITVRLVFGWAIIWGGVQDVELMTLSIICSGVGLRDHGDKRFGVRSHDLERDTISSIKSCCGSVCLFFESGCCCIGSGEANRFLPFRLTTFFLFLFRTDFFIFDEISSRLIAIGIFWGDNENDFDLTLRVDLPLINFDLERERGLNGDLLKPLSCNGGVIDNFRRWRDSVRLRASLPREFDFRRGDGDRRLGTETLIELCLLVLRCRLGDFERRRRGGVLDEVLGGRDVSLP